MRISQRQNYHRENPIAISYFNIMSQIATFLSVPLRKRYRLRKKNLQENSYEVRSGSDISNYIILSYLLKFPLFSYKFRAVPVQIELLQLSVNKNYKLPTGLNHLNKLKIKMRLNITNDTSSPLVFTYKKDHFDHIIKYFPF